MTDLGLVQPPFMHRWLIFGSETRRKTPVSMLLRSAEEREYDMKRTTLALTTLAVLSAGVPATNAHAGDPGAAAAAAGFLGGVVGGLLLGPPPPPPPYHRPPPAAVFVYPRPGPPHFARYDDAPPPHFAHRRGAVYDGRADGYGRSYDEGRGYDDYDRSYGD